MIDWTSALEVAGIFFMVLGIALFATRYDDTDEYDFFQEQLEDEQ